MMRPEPQGLYGRFEEEKSLLPLSALELLTSQPVAYSLQRLR